MSRQLHLYVNYVTIIDKRPVLSIYKTLIFINLIFQNIPYNYSLATRSTQSNIILKILSQASRKLIVTIKPCGLILDKTIFAR